MAFCRFCGKEIPEGNICDECKATHPEQNVQPVQPVQNEQPAADSTVTPNPVPTDAPAADSKNENKRNLIILGAAAVIILVIIIAIISSIAGGGYKKPIKNFVKGMNKADSEKICQAFFPDDFLDDMADEEDVDLDDLYDEMDESIEDSLDELEDVYGKHVKISFDVEDKDKLDDDDLDDIQDLYDDADMDVEIKKGYEVSGTLTIKGKDDDDDTDLDFYVVKIKGEGWKICPFEGDMENFADMLDNY